MASERSEQITNEMILFSVSIIRMVEKVTIPISVKNQLIRSATSIGANFAEAQESATKRDFINKIAISKKEANETKYWLKLVAELGYRDQEIEATTQKFLMILQKIISTSKGVHSA